MNRIPWTSLEECLAAISALQAQEINLGLERVSLVARRMGFSQPSCPVLVVGGTNGKGSCVAALERIYLEQGYQTGAFTSPILYRHHELLRIQGKTLEDAFFLEAYAEIEAVRAELLLTPFEYHTLAVLSILRRHPLDVWILEVGLGGRLDAVNIVDADVSLITSIDLDHVEWLGETRELIAKEKAGIFRPYKPAVCGDFNPPQTLIEQAKKLETPLYCQGKDFHFSLKQNSFDFQGKHAAYFNLPLSKLAFQNLSTALMAIELLQTKLPVSEEAIRRGIESVSLPGRIEIQTGPVTVILDVAHNPAALAFLAERLRKMLCAGKKRAVFSMLADKDLRGSLRAIKEQIEEWYVAPLKGKRAASIEQLRNAFQEENIASVYFYESLSQAKAAAVSFSKEKDYLLFFGSFHVLAETIQEKLLD